LIRKYGYRGTPATLAAVDANADLAGDLSAAAHLIHGSSEGRFNITWCPGHLTREEVEGVGFNYADLNSMLHRYNPEAWRTATTTSMAKKYSSSQSRPGPVGAPQPALKGKNHEFAAS
jgi:hypothetical protein